MAPANSSLRASVPSLAAIEHLRRELLAWQAAQRAPSAESVEPPFGPRTEAPKMPAGGINAHLPQRKSGHFRCPNPSTRSLCGRAKPPMRHIRRRASKIRVHVGLLALLRLARQSPYALAAANKKTSGAFQLIATSLTEYPNGSSSHMRIGDCCSKIFRKGAQAAWQEMGALRSG
jgi:hypothetical protein